MKIIKKNNDFESYSDDNLDFINESKVFYLPSFSSKLMDISSNTVDVEIKDLIENILKSEGDVLDSDTTFIGLSDDTDMCSFSTEKDIKSKYPDEWDYLFNPGSLLKDPKNAIKRIFHTFSIERIESSQSQKLKIGKLIKKIVPNITDSTLERLVNLLKTYKTGYEIKVVEGDEIAKYYTKENCVNTGTLSKSCMVGKSNDIKHIFDIYTKNPQSVKMVVMLNEKGLCVSRAILWKISEIIPYYKTEDLFKELPNFKENGWFKTDDLLFMDRVYYSNDWQEQSMFNWAKEKNIPFKYGSKCFFKGSIGMPSIKVKLKPLSYRNFPYLDTLIYYNVKSSTLSNLSSDPTIFPPVDFNVQSIDGNYFGGTKLDKVRNYVRRFKDFF
jgi:hypothetical protein